ncbi:MAG: helix-turn-helix domain-containing protein [Abditibacteriota bacterium]|nr:helix-turn-helix domain-containing protein [Abditibacteriota bacterium]
MSCSNSKIKELIAEHVHNQRHREVLILCLADGWTYERIAEETGYSSRHVGTIVRKWRAVLQTMLEQN